MSKPLIGIVLVNYNGHDLTIKTIESIFASGYPNVEIIVVDNKSIDDSIDLIEKKYPRLKIIKNNENLGFGEANNQGINYLINQANCEYILLLNNDVEIDKNLIYELLKKASISVVTVPKIMYFDTPNIIWYGGGYINFETGSVKQRGINENDSHKYDFEEYVTFASGCCLLIHSEILKKIGGFDESYFMYYEDTDLCMKFIHNNIKIKYCPKAKLWHKVSSSSGGITSRFKTYYKTRNKLYFLRKYHMEFRNVKWWRIIIADLIRWSASFFVRKYNRTILKGYIDYLNGKMRKTI